jgi:2-oxoisovalerate dehydrogenase E1 component alpha subunit
MSSAPYLHVPKPPARPGDPPDFSYLITSPAGAVERPATDASIEQIQPLATGLVRILDDEHHAVGPWRPEIAADTLRAGLRNMVLTRAYDERMQRMQRQGRISFYVKSTGEEATAVAACMAMADSDMLFPSYRTQGLHITRGMQVTDMMCQLLSNTRDMCRGRQMPVFYHSAKLRLFTISGNLATQFPQAVGWAMGAAIKGENDIAAAWTGDGSTAEGDFHYAMTFASVYLAPVILNVVNNQWAISSFQSFAGGERATIAQRGVGYGVPAIRVDGNDFLAVYAVTRWAAERARSRGGPTLIEHVTYRVEPHSTSDDPSRYKPRDEAKAWPLGDPIERLKNHLISLGEWSEARHTALREACEQQVREAWQEALTHGSMTEGPSLCAELMFEDVYREMPPHLQRQREQLRQEVE